MSQEMANKIRKNTEQDKMSKVLCSTIVAGKTYLFTGFIFYARPSAFTSSKLGGIMIFCNPYSYQFCVIKLNANTRKYSYKSLF